MILNRLYSVKLFKCLPRAISSLFWLGLSLKYPKECNIFSQSLAGYNLFVDFLAF